MRSTHLSSFVIAVALAIGGCAFVPKSNLRLEEARAMHRAAQADGELAQLAPNELSRASETFRLADTAWNTLDDVAVVDHLAYMAKQRLAIASETARKVAAERAARVARIQHEVILASSNRATALIRTAGDPR